MPKSRPPYAAAFRRQMVELVRSGRTPEALAREFEPSAQAIRNWVAQAGRDAGERTDGLLHGKALSVGCNPIVERIQCRNREQPQRSTCNAPDHPVKPTQAIQHGSRPLKTTLVAG